MKKISLFLISIFCICLISACSSKEDSIEIQNTQINDFSEKNTENKSIDDKISYMDLEYDEINKNLTLLDLGLNQVLQEVPVESISEFSFSDLAMEIYTKVVLEG